ncbi:LamG domain-containing protein [Inmirania thermothiophila]|uniref:Putative secreted protein with PEP-CTERM sorting signal n=1 Tax=Inmirania thermothiophila TaxID=1750597 RepID=A0A3N1XSN5_9GAMM|nr:LamG domain-containing protein [Inmirania thermothiophila]ROR29655.1 putative secreted protein with PEP-CTERM sorting signal [Inmirania thermothiophila]
MTRPAHLARHRRRLRLLAAALALAASGATHAIPAAVPVAWYPLDGDAADASGNGLDGTIHGSVTATAGHDGTPWAALAFDAGGYIDLGSPSALQITGPLTLSVWIRFEVGGSWNPRILSYNDHHGYTLFTWGTGTARTLSFDYGGVGGSPARVSTPDPLEAGRWYHIAAVGDPADGARLYVDGMLVASNPLAVVPEFAGSANIGRKSSWAWDWWRGAIDDLAIYDVALDAEAVRRLAADGPATASVPEPASLALLVTGALIAAAGRRRARPRRPGGAGTAPTSGR